MKLLLPILALLLFTLGCTKYEAEYAVNCQFGLSTSPSFGKRILLVTNANGDLLQKFDVPPRVNNLSEQFTIDGKDLPERYDLHFLHFRDSNNQDISVHSHFDIPNGASVYLSSDFFGSNSTLDKINLRVEGIESFDSLRVIGDGEDILYFKPELEATKKTLTKAAFRSKGHGIVLHLRANGEPDFRQLFLPAENIVLEDTIVVDWQDFKPENSPRIIEVPGNDWINNLEVTAISPDFKQFVTLEDRRSVNSQAIPLQFHHPDGLEEPIAYRILVDRSDDDYEKIFQPGEQLRFEPANMTIDSFGLSGRNLRVKSVGNIDMLRIITYAFDTNNTGRVIWTIDGTPETLQERILPDLSGYLPGWYFASSPHFKVGALQFDLYDYPQLREGFPYRLNEPFAVARSGYRAVWKYFF